MFGELPEKFRPNCDKLDENGYCPKDVPRLRNCNVEAHEIFRVLSEGFVDPETGLVRFDALTVEQYAAILTADVRERQVLFLKTLLLVSALNEGRVELLNKPNAPPKK
jgi:hypothetical protein